jgi:hypothetical protein
MKTIKAKEKNVYGNNLLYPACEVSQMFCDIALSKTLTPHILNIAAKNGYKLEKITLDNPPAFIVI